MLKETTITWILLIELLLLLAVSIAVIAVSISSVNASRWRFLGNNFSRRSQRRAITLSKLFFEELQFLLFRLVLCVRERLDLLTILLLRWSWVKLLLIFIYILLSFLWMIMLLNITLRLCVKQSLSAIVMTNSIPIYTFLLIFVWLLLLLPSLFIRYLNLPELLLKHFNIHLKNIKLSYRLEFVSFTNTQLLF